MSRRAALVLVILTVTSMGAAPGGATSGAGGRAPDHPMIALERAKGSDLGSLLAARRTLLTASRAEGGVGLTPLGRGRAGGRTSGFSWTSGMVAPDLDGDGGDDVLVVYQGEGLDAALSALRGVDGSPLWVEPFEFPTFGGWWNAYTFLDVAGDPAPEALVYRERVTEQAVRPPFGAAERQTLRQIVEIIDARTGEIIHTLTYDATFTFVSGVLTSVTMFENLMLGLASAGDVGGAASPDLLVNLEDHRDVRVGHPSVPTQPLAETIGIAHLLDVDAGSEIAVLRERAPTGFVWFEPVGDLDGDGIPDLAAYKGSVSDGSGGIVALRVDGSRVWEVPTGDAVFPAWPTSSLPLVHAGSPDVVGTVLGLYDWRTIALRGTSGETLWDVEGVVHFAPIGDVDGGGAEDLMVSLTDALGEDVAVQAVDGATLSRLWHRPNTTEADVREFGCGQCSQDVTGDGVVDPTVHRFLGVDPGPFTHEYITLDGRDGSELWRRSSPSWLDLDAPLHGDIGGDATEDLAIARAVRDGRRWSLIVDVVEGSDLSPLWSVSVRAPEEPGYFLGRVADLDGDGIRDIVANVSAETPDGHILRVLALGVDGLRWAA